MLVSDLLSSANIILIDGELGDVCDGYTYVRIRPLRVPHPLAVLDDILRIQNATALNGKELAGTWILNISKGDQIATHDIPRCTLLLGSVFHELG
jgi:hypothetical protein